MDPVLLASLNSYLFMLHLTHLTLLQIRTCLKSNNTNARLMAFAFSLTSDPMFGIHSHRTGNAQLFHLLRQNWKFSFFHSTSIPVNFRSHFSYQKLYLSECVCVCVCINAIVCVCTCVCVLMLMYWFAPFICLFVKLLCLCICFFVELLCVCV